MGQRQRSRLALVVVVVAAALPAYALAAEAAAPAAPETAPEAAPADAPADAPAPPDGRYKPPFVLGVGGGYAFRPHADERNHGGGAHLYGDAPLWHGFGLRLEALALAFGPSPLVERPLLSPLAAGSLLYAFDDTDTVPVVGVGVFAGLPYDVTASGSAGVLLSLGLRFPVFDGVFAEASIRLPFTLWSNAPPPPEPSDDLRVEVLLGGALVFEPMALWDLAARPR